MTARHFLFDIGGVGGGTALYMERVDKGISDQKKVFNLSRMLFFKSILSEFLVAHCMIAIRKTL